jgi:hypothetical protein
MKRSSGIPKFGLVAFSTCAFELVGIGIGTFIILRIPSISAPWLDRVLAFLYLAGLLSLPVSIVGLFKDNPRVVALVALVFGIVNIFLCALLLIPLID